MKSKSNATAARPAILDWTPSWLVLVGLALAGTVLILFVHNFRAAPSVLFLNMAWFSIIGAGALLWRVGLLVAAGDQGDDGSFDATSSRVDELKAEKASLLKAIKEVEFDRMMGKLSEVDAAEITDVYRKRAIIILKELDSVEGSDGDEELTIAERIERDLRARAELARADRGTARRAEARKARSEGSEAAIERMDKALDKNKAVAAEDALRAEEEEE